MRRAQQPLFLARAVYRKRRLRDAARMLPIFGFVLLTSVMWNVSARAWVYVFAVWLGLIVLAAILARGLGQEVDESRRDSVDELPADLGGDDAL